MSRMWKNQTYYLHQLCNKLHRPQCVSIMREENPVAMVMATRFRDICVNTTVMCTPIAVCKFQCAFVGICTHWFQTVLLSYSIVHI